MGRYSNYDFSKIKDVINKFEHFSVEELTEQLNNSNINQEIVNDFNQGRGNFYEYFRLLINEIGVDNFLRYYDFNEIHKYFKKEAKYEEYKVFVCLMENNNINKVLQHSLKDETLFEQIFKNQDQMYSIFGNVEYEILVEIIKKIEQSNNDYSSIFLSSIEEDKLINLLHENLTNETIWWMLPNLRKNVIEYFFLNDPRALTAIEEKKISVPNLIDKEIKISPNIIYTNVFFDCLKSRSLVEFRRRINSLSEINPNIVIEQKAEKYEAEMLESYNPETGLFKEYEEITFDNMQDIIDKGTNKYLLSYQIIHDVYSIKCNQDEINNKLNQYLKDITSKKISEIVIDALFKDNYYNVRLNIEEILRYHKKNKDGFSIDLEYIKLYELVYNIDYLSNDKKIDLYNNLKKKNMNTIFYNHLRECKNHAYSDMISKLFNLEDTNLINKNLSEQKGVNIYELNGEEFTMIVSGKNTFRENAGVQRGCYSLIDNNNMEVKDNYNYYYGYYNVDKNNIIHVFENDSFSADSKDTNTNRINRIMTNEEISDVKGYSEVQIANKKTEEGYEILKPDYLVVLDELEERHIREAERLNIPIIKIDKSKYKQQSNEPSHMLYTNVEDGYRYIETEQDENAWNRANKRR